eukprot:415788_1
MENKYDEEPLGEEVKRYYELIEIDTNNIKEEMKALTKTTASAAAEIVDEMKYSAIKMPQHNEDKDNHYLFHHDIDTIDQKEMDKLMFNIDDFVHIKIDDYSNCGQSITQCNAMKRILHLLKYHKNDRALIYEYLKQLSSNYEIANVMDDWHHVKKTHLQHIVNIGCLTKYKAITCPSKNKCIYFNRHQRDRNQEVYNIDKDTDHKNLILIDQLDSIHSYIFHAINTRG